MIPGKSRARDMEDKATHPALEARLEALEGRIAELKSKLATAQGTERIGEVGEVKELELRHKELLERVRKVKLQGPEFWEDVKAELEGTADDLVETVEDFILWADTGGASGRKPTSGTKR